MDTVCGHQWSHILPSNSPIDQRERCEIFLKKKLWVSINFRERKSEKPDFCGAFVGTFGGEGAPQRFSQLGVLKKLPPGGIPAVGWGSGGLYGLWARVPGSGEVIGNAYFWDGVLPNRQKQRYEAQKHKLWRKIVLNERNRNGGKDEISSHQRKIENYRYLNILWMLGEGEKARCTENWTPSGARESKKEKTNRERKIRKGQYSELSSNEICSSKKALSEIAVNDYWRERERDKDM